MSFICIVVMVIMVAGIAAILGEFCESIMGYPTLRDGDEK